ncbi:MAG: hypothetical protein POELPBGB_02949 [Bacteroidia bacterium]|nr:hypothetical protein [Bacteroidia bacterium]
MRIKKILWGALPVLTGLFVLQTFAQTQYLPINNLIISSGSPSTYEAQQIVSPETQTQPVNISQNAIVNFKASEQIQLKPGFRASNFFAVDNPEGNTVNGRFHAFIDPLLTTPVNYDENLFSEEDFDNHTIDVSKAVGYIPSSHSVTPTGAAIYSIPIPLPPGTNGMVPSLALSYNSQSGNGILGMGWNIAGLSAINRVPKTLYHNEKVAPVACTWDDDFTLDGNRLIKLSDGSYRTETETFSKINAVGISYWGPNYFEVLTKEGNRIEYGRTENSSFFNETTSNNYTCLYWLINKIADRHGNYIEFVYRHEDREVVIDKIKYTGNVNAGLLPYNEIQFFYDIRDDKNTSYISGASVKSSLLLKRIKITTDGQDYKIYKFNYALNLYSFLKEIQEFGSDGSEVNSTIFNYGENVTDVQESSSGLQTGENVDVFTGDFNGDGKADVVKAQKIRTSEEPEIFKHTSFQMYVNNDGILEPSITDFFALDNFEFEIRALRYPDNRGFVTSDYNGDGKDDLLLVDIRNEGTELFANVINIYYSDDEGSFAAPVSLTLPDDADVSPFTNSFYPGDYDGDGATDLLAFLGNKIYIAFPRTGNNFREITSISTPITIDGETADFHLHDRLRFTDEIFVIDFDGDRKSELLSVGQWLSDGVENLTDEIFTFDVTENSITLKSLYEEDFTWDNPTLLGNPIHLGDFNGDGKTDLFAQMDDENWQVNYSTGSGFNRLPFTFSYYDEELSPFNIKIADYNGDGKSDILYTYRLLAHIIGAETDGNGNPIPIWANDQNQISLYISNGIDFQPYEEILEITPQGWLGQGLLTGDFNGDGKYDELKLNDNIAIESKIFHFFKNGQERYLKGAKNGFNQTVTFNYQWLSQTDELIYTVGFPQDYPLINFRQALPVVTSVTTPDGIGGINITDYSYTEAKVHKQGKGFLGFHTITAFSHTTDITSISEYEIKGTEEHKFYAPVLKENRSYYQTPLFPVSKTTYTTDIIALDEEKRYWIKTISKTDQDFINLFRTETSYSYYPGNTGNIYATSTEYVGTGETRETQFGEYISNGSWMPWLPSSVTNSTTRIEDSGTDNFTTSTLFTYNTNGTLLSKTDFAGLPKSVITDVEEYDVFGNPKHLKISSAGLQPRTNKFDYDSKGRFAIKKYNALDQFEEYIYDNRWGQPLTAKDISGLTTSFEYDGFGRLKKTTSPHSIVSTINYEWAIGSMSNSVFLTKSSSQGSPESITVYDAFGRTLSNKTEGFGGNDVFVKQEYDERGNVKTQSSPFYLGGTPVITTYSYDEYNRIESETNSTGPTTYQYGFNNGFPKVRITDSGGNWNETTTDASGKVLTSEDEGGKISYEYWGSGNLRSTNLNGVTINTIGDDDYGRQDELWDINAGTTSYEYNAYGELISQTDAEEITYELIYDVLGRLRSNTKTSGGVHYTFYDYWDNGNGINQIKNITTTLTENGITTNTFQDYSYDAFDRLTQYKEAIAGDEEFITRYTYDNYNNLITQTYPSGFRVKNYYDSKGYLTNIKDDVGGTTLFTANEANALGQLTNYKLGNTKITENTFDEFGYLRQTQTPGVQNMTFDFNVQTGNLTKREDILNGLLEDFEYDGLNRLRKWQVENYPECEIIYEPNGNIQSKCDAGIYTYNAPQINAVTSVTNPITHVSLTPEDVTYTPFRRPSSITEGDYELKLFYGADDHRLKTVLKNNGLTERTTSYSLDFERVKIENSVNTEDDGIYDVNYISGANAIAVSKDGATPELYYVYTDHLGSVLTLTDENGDAVLSQSFDAWGRNRNPEDWTFTDVPENNLPWFNRGFTGHEHLKEFALINMNARLYDPMIGRVLGVDNYVQDPLFSQSYNRYSYCINNPLKFTDPTGDMFWSFNNMETNFMASGGDMLLNASAGETAPIPEWLRKLLEALGLVGHSPGKTPPRGSDVAVSNAGGASSGGNSGSNNAATARGLTSGDMATLAQMGFTNNFSTNNGIIRANELGFMDLWSNPSYNVTLGPVERFSLNLSYSVADGAFLFPQLFFVSKQYQRHLNGAGVNSSNERFESFMTVAPASLGVISNSIKGVGAVAKSGGFAERLFLSENFGITSEKFGSSLVNAPGVWNKSGSLFKIGWSKVARNGGGMQMRIGIGSKIAKPNQSLFHMYIPKTYVPNSFANPSMQVKLSIYKLGGIKYIK